MGWEPSDSFILSFVSSGYSDSVSELTDRLNSFPYICHNDLFLISETVLCTTQPAALEIKDLFMFIRVPLFFAESFYFIKYSLICLNGVYRIKTRNYTVKNKCLRYNLKCFFKVKLFGSARNLLPTGSCCKASPKKKGLKSCKCDIKNPKKRFLRIKRVARELKVKIKSK